MTLEQFVKNYNTTQLKKGELSYGDYLSVYEGDPYNAYRDTLDTLDTQYRRAASDYGMRGERLSEMGLLGSGYAAHLDASAYAELQRGRQAARDSVQRTLGESAVRYEKYLSDIRTAKENKIRQVKEDILSQGISDPEEAYNYAQSQGLSAEESEELAFASVELLQDADQKKLIQLIMEKGLDPERAIALGIYYGLPRDRIDQIVHFASVMHGYGPSVIPQPDYYTNYLEYIESLKK